MDKRLTALAIFLFIATLFILGHPEAGFSAYDAALPADNSKIASGPAMIRENFRALKEDAIVNAGKLASQTATELLEEARGVYLSCVASTTATAMLTASGAYYNVGTATGVYNIVIEGSAVASETGDYPGYGTTLTYFFGVRVGTTTELLFSGDPLHAYSRDSDAALWSVAIATSTTRGEITTVASGPVGAVWEFYARKRGASW
jgi:hypothetical protein